MKNVIKVMALSFLSAIAVNANAAMVNQLVVVGSLETNTGFLDTATTIALGTVDGFDATGDLLSSAVDKTGSGALIPTSITPPFSPFAGFMSIDGWTFDLNTLSIMEQTASLLWLEGTGTLYNTAGSYDATWALTAQTATSYSMDVTVVPVPAAVWLFGSGLIGLVGLARRKA